jgi:hypothetical protein
MSARSPALTALLAKYGIAPCGAHSCVFGNPPNHVGLNGGCQCADEMFGDGRGMRLHEFARHVQRLAAIIRELDQQPEQIAAWLEQCGDYAETGRFAASLAEDVRAGQWKEQG